MHIRRTSVA